MNALDTNVLVRLVVEDDQAQASKAQRLIEETLAQAERCLISLPVLCEFQWVLTRSYKASREDLARVVAELLDDDSFVIEAAPSVRHALARFRHGHADFADYLIGARSQALGAATTYSFDKALQNEPDFTWLG